MKVVMLAGTLELSDAVVYTLSLGRGLIGRGHDVRLIAAHGPLSDLLETDPLHHVAHTLTGSRWRDVFEMQRLDTALGDFEPDCIHVTDESLDLAGHQLSRRWRVPRVLTHHGRTPMLSARRKPEVILVPAQGQRATVVHDGGIDAERVRVVPYGLPDIPEPAPAALTDGHRPSVGAVGPLRRGRGLKQFVHAMRRVADAHPGALFPVLGSGPYHPFILRHAEALGLSDRVIVAESCSEPRMALAALDVIVLPSVDEEFGCLAALAMALGRPVVASAVGQAFDLIDDGKTGLLVPPGDDNALAEQVMSLLSDPQRARDLGAAARAAMRQRHPLEAMIDGTISAFEALYSRSS